MSDLSIPIDKLLAAGALRAAGPDKRGLPEVQVLRLREALTRYGAPNPFTAGDLVTPRADATLAGAGDPHIVLETLPRIMPSFQSDSCCSDKRFDTRIAWIDRKGYLRTNWVEAYELEPWAPAAPATAEAPPPPAPDETAVTGPWARAEAAA